MRQYLCQGLEKMKGKPLSLSRESVPGRVTVSAKALSDRVPDMFEGDKVRRVHCQE